MRTAPWRQPGHTPRRSSGLTSYERVLARAGLAPVAGIDEAGRGACAGPLVVGAVILDPRKSSKLDLLADSKALTPAVREIVYDQVVAAALSWHAVVIPASDIDRLGLHVCNLAGMRRALAGLSCRPGYVLTDGFAVRGLATPALGMWQGDRLAACISAASVIAKVTRDRNHGRVARNPPPLRFRSSQGVLDGSAPGRPGRARPVPRASALLRERARGAAKPPWRKGDSRDWTPQQRLWVRMGKGAPRPPRAISWTSAQSPKPVSRARLDS